jgi:hypothetical protein
MTLMQVKNCLVKKKAVFSDQLFLQDIILDSRVEILNTLYSRTELEVLCNKSTFLDTNNERDLISEHWRNHFNTPVEVF